MINNKRGSWDGTIYIVGGLAILLFCAFIFVFGSSTLKYVADQVVPIFDGLGMVGDVNATYISSVTVHPVYSIINSLSWMGTVVFIFGIIAVFGLAYVYRVTAQRWLIPLFFTLMFLLVLICIFMSNMYQDFLNGTDDIAMIMQSFGGINYFILYSPIVMSIIGFLAGAIMFGGAGEDQ